MAILCYSSINMALTKNIRSLMNKIVVAELRPNIRLYSDSAEETPNEEEREIDPAKDRRKPMPVETSIKYLQSKAYQQTYGTDPVWVMYRRNHKGAFAPRKTRRSCVRNGVISTGNPCPICRDEYLVLDHKNTKLLEQFISQYTGQILEPFKTGICQRQHKQLLVAIVRAWDQGIITYDVPFREYDYSLYNKYAQ